MPFLTKDDLITHIYPEIIDVITRVDDSIVDRAISAAVAEAKSCLSRYDLLAIFGNNTTAPTFTEEYLNNLVKDIACWRLVILANPNINMEVIRAAYTDAKKALMQASKGDTDPDWPLRTDLANTGIPGLANNTGDGINNGYDTGGNVGWNSNRKRTQHF